MLNKDTICALTTTLYFFIFLDKIILYSGKLVDIYLPIRNATSIYDIQDKSIYRKIFI